MKRENDPHKDNPIVVMSFDFEMRWGVHEIYGMDESGYKKNLENCRPVVEFMLEELAQKNLRATWATVGALGTESWEEYFSLAPPAPKYENSNIAVRKRYASLDPKGRYHFAPDLVRLIVNTEGQELGNHTFSHLFFREPGVTAVDFLKDLAAVEKLWSERYGVTPVSLVFPRNQSAFLDKLKETSVKIWRGPEPAWFYDCTSRSKDTLIPKCCRLIDSINPWVRRASEPENGMLRASVFVRFSLPESLWNLQLARIKNELNKLMPGNVFHLWWHPHNLGFDLSKGLIRFGEIVDLICYTCENKGIVSRNMRDFFMCPNSVNK